MATLDAAQVLGQGDNLGQIAPGRQADLVVLRENPLEEIAATQSIESVWQDGVQVADAL
jgi:imidazolonepropionase-like amidohydrolase